MYCQLITELSRRLHRDSASAASAAAGNPAGGAPSARSRAIASAGQPPRPVAAPSLGQTPAPLPSSGVPSSGLAGQPSFPVVNGRAVIPPPPPARTIPVVIPIAAVATLSTVTASLDANRARIEDDRRTNATYDVEIQKKFAISVACAIFVLLGAPVALRFPRGGVGLVIGVSFAVFGLYYVGLIAGEPLAQNGAVSSFWAMWVSNVVFLVVGLAMLARVGRAGSTSRGGELGEWKDALRAWWSNLRFGTRPRSLETGPAS